MLKAMWKNLMKLGVPAAPAEIIPANMPRPESHCCPNCGAGITKLHLYQGGILGRTPGGVRKVRAAIRCLHCGRQHALQGETPYERGVVLILLSHPRKKPGERQKLFRTGALA